MAHRGRFQGPQAWLWLLMLLYVHFNHQDYKGRGAQDGRLDFHTAPRIFGLISLSIKRSKFCLLQNINVGEERAMGTF